MFDGLCLGSGTFLVAEVLIALTFLLLIVLELLLALLLALSGFCRGGVRHCRLVLAVESSRPLWFFLKLEKSTRLPLLAGSPRFFRLFLKLVKSPRFVPNFLARQSDDPVAVVALMGTTLSARRPRARLYTYSILTLSPSMGRPWNLSA